MSHYSDNLTLSLFPGVGLLDKAFEAEGFSVVRGPDLIFGGDVRGFHVPAGRFDLVIGGSPCQDFSIARRSEPTGEGVELLGHFVRLVEEAQPAAFLLENVPHVPDVQIAGYQVQRFDLRASECGGKQARLRHFQFGSRRGLILLITRQPRPGHVEPAALATEGKRKARRTWADFCEVQGLPRDFDLPSFTQAAKYQAVGNGVPLQVGRAVARAIREALTSPNPLTFDNARLCACRCGRVVTGKQVSATDACRHRLRVQRLGLRGTVTA